MWVFLHKIRALFMLYLILLMQHLLTTDIPNWLYIPPSQVVVINTTKHDVEIIVEYSCETNTEIIISKTLIAKNDTSPTIIPIKNISCNVSAFLAKNSETPFLQYENVKRGSTVTLKEKHVTNLLNNIH